MNRKKAQCQEVPATISGWLMFAFAHTLLSLPRALFSDRFTAAAYLIGAKDFLAAAAFLLLPLIFS